MTLSLKNRVFPQSLKSFTLITKTLNPQTLNCNLGHIGYMGGPLMPRASWARGEGFI